MGHHHKETFKKIALIHFDRGFWTTRIAQKHNLKCNDYLLTESFSIKNMLSFPVWMLIKIFKNPPADSYYLFITEFFWRLGILWALINNRKYVLN